MHKRLQTTVVIVVKLQEGLETLKDTQSFIECDVRVSQFHLAELRGPDELPRQLQACFDIPDEADDADGDTEGNRNSPQQRIFISQYSPKMYREESSGSGAKKASSC